MIDEFKEAESARDLAVSRARESERALARHVESIVKAARPRTVLVLEDDAQITKLIARTLAKLDVAVSYVTTIAEAERALGLTDDAPAAPLPGVALMDLLLPDGNAGDLAMRVPRSVEVVLMSAVVDPDILGHLADKVGARFLPKQSLLTLPEIIEDLLDE